VFEVLVDITCIVALLVIFRPLVLKYFGPKQSYQLWLAIPFYLIYSLLPNEAKISLPIQAIDYYAVNFNRASIVENITQYNYVSLLYLTGVICGLLILSLGLLSFHSKNPKYQLATQKLPNKQTNVPIYWNEQITSPILVGIFKPAIHIPLDFFIRYSEFQQYAVLKHELYHHHRKDILWNLIANFLVVLFWFNPIFWLGYRLFRQDQELSCDEAVLNGETAKNKQEYAKVLLTSNTHYWLISAQTSFGKKGNAKMMKERINAIKKTGVYNKYVTLVGFICLTLASMTQLNATSINKEQKQIEKLSNTLKPIVRINPQYPQEAAKAGVEGWVILEFGVSQNGTVENIRVTASHPESIFDEAAKRAVAKWRYKPHTLDQQVNTVELAFKL